MKCFILLVGLLLSVCVHASPRDYFNYNKDGSGDDYGIFKHNFNRSKNNDHVISVHGFYGSGDYEVCKRLALFMNNNAFFVGKRVGQKIYFCNILN